MPRKFGYIYADDSLTVEDVTGLGEELSNKGDKSMDVPAGAIVMWPESRPVPEGWTQFAVPAALKSVLPKGVTLIQKQ